MTLKGIMTTTMAGLLALAVLVPASARADSKDVAKIIAGTAALVIIGAAIADAVDDDDDYYVSRRGYYGNQYRWGHRSNRHLRHQHHNRHYYRHGHRHGHHGEYRSHRRRND